MYYQSIKHCPNPIAIKPLYELLSKNESFGTNLGDIKCDAQLGINNFFYVYNINNEPVGFFYLYEYPNDFEIVLGKFQHIEEKGFINFVLSQLDSALEQFGIKPNYITAIIKHSNPDKKAIITGLERNNFHEESGAINKEMSIEMKICFLEKMGSFIYVLNNSENEQK